MMTTDLNQEPVSAAATVCDGCGQTLNDKAETKYCGNCGFPANDTPQAKKKFIGYLKVKRIELEEEHAKINKARIYFFVIAGLILISGFILSAAESSEFATIELIASTMISVIYIVLALLIKKYPLPICIIGLVLFASIILIGIIGDLSNIYKGIIVKALAIYAMIYGIMAARRIKVLEKELAQYKNIKLS